MIGLSEALAQTTYKATLKTVSACECLTIAREDLIALLRQDAALCESLVRDLALHVNTAFEALRKSGVTQVTYAEVTGRYDADSISSH